MMQGKVRHGSERPGIAWPGDVWSGVVSIFKDCMMDLCTVSVKIRGVTPLLVHKFDDAEALAASSRTRSAIIGEQLSAYDQAAKCLYLNDGKPFIPGANVFRAIIDAGSFIKNGRSKMSTQKSSIIPACVSVDEPYLYIDSPQPWTVDTRPVRIPATGGRILRHRPMFEKWGLNFSLTLDLEMIAENIARQLVDIAGSRLGLGDFRPACKGPYGRFVVDQWKRS